MEYNIILIFATSILIFALYSIYQLNKQIALREKMDNEKPFKKALRYLHEHQEGSDINVLIDMFSCEVVEGLIYGNIIEVSGLSTLRERCGNCLTLNQERTFAHV